MTNTAAPKPAGLADRVSPRAQILGDWADALAKARLSGGLVRASPCEALTAREAFAVQRAVTDRLGERVAGWKTAGPGAGGLPLVAPLLSKSVIASPGQAADIAGAPLMLEVEFGLRLRDDIGPQDLSTSTDARMLVGEVFVALELCRTRLADPDPSQVQFLADGLANAGLVVGGGAPAGPHFRFAGRRVILSVNGSVVADLTTGIEAEDTAAKLLWLVQEAAAQGQLAGGVVITGSLTGATTLSPGDIAHAWIEGLGEAEVRLGAAARPH